MRSQWFAVVGLSVSCEVQLDALVSTIRLIRRASRNQAVGIFVGGPVFVEHPKWYRLSERMPRRSMAVRLRYKPKIFLH